MTDIGHRTPGKRKLPPGYNIDRVVDGFTYPRNGNAHNPTPKHRWEAFHGGSLIGTQGSEQGAVDLVIEHAKELP